MKRLLLSSLLSLLICCCQTFGAVAIINGSSGTSESGTTASITNNLDTLLQAAGATTQVFDGVPSDLSGFTQIWDIRFSNNLAISAAEESQYVGFLQDGGGMFVMGENNGFTQRNNSVISLIAAAGGGSLGFVVPIDPQTVLAPFTGPNPVASIDYAAGGGVNSSGSGQFITVDANGNGTGVAFGVGDLSNASAGALTTIFDVNFMQGTRGEDQQNLLKNLINFVEEEVEPDPDPDPPGPDPGPDPPGGAVPEPTSILIWSTIGACFWIGYRKRRA